MELGTMRNTDISFHVQLPVATSNTVIIMFDSEPFKSVIMTHYFRVCFDLYSLWQKKKFLFSCNNGF